MMNTQKNRNSSRILLMILTLFIYLSCQQKTTVDQITSLAIKYAGGNQFENSKISFDFREHHYSVYRKEGDWKMSRSLQDTNNLILDTYSPKGFTRQINGKEVSVADSMAFKYTESINSVIYFALLPYKLNDQAVIKESLGKEKIEGRTYHTVKVSFKKEGGGEDYQDEFIYWFNEKDYSLDYLAYTFHVNGGGMRFRKAYNERFVKGIRFVDYVNYKPFADSASLSNLAELYQQNKLKELSRIELKDIEVSLEPS